LSLVVACKLGRAFWRWGLESAGSETNKRKERNKHYCIDAWYWFLASIGLLFTHKYTHTKGGKATRYTYESPVST
jgi:hypothetical protein